MSGRPRSARVCDGSKRTGWSKFGAAVARQVAYETLYVDTPGGPVRKDTGVPTPFQIGVLAGILLNGAAGQSLIFQTGGTCSHM